jgi:hypothetical protein
MKGFFTLFILLFFSPVIILKGQVHRCYSDELLEKRLGADPTAMAEWEKTKAFLLENAQVANFISNRSVLTIPVVVHILYRFPDQNLSDEQVYSQIEVLNADFRGINCEIASLPAEFKPLAIDTEIEFCLTDTDPFGNPTNGITRTLTNIPVFDPNGKNIYYSDRGGADAWNPEKYLNIWVAPLGGTLGFASFPGSNIPPAEDGVVVDYTGFGTIGTAENPYNLGRTTTHEIGHYFSLRHPFAVQNLELCIYDDGIEDTPMQGPNYGGSCPSYPQYSCGSSDMFMNFMNYSNDACLNMFTPGQKANMLAAIVNFRPGLLANNSCLREPADGFQLEIVLFPNPTNEKIRLFTPSANIPIGAIRIANISGQLIYTNKEWPTMQTLDVSSWTNGIYFVEFYCNGQTWNGKFVKL